MTLIKKIKDKKVNFEFNKEYIKVVNEKIQNNDALFITNSLNEFVINKASLADILSVTTLIYSLLNSKLTFLSLIFFTKVINSILKLYALLIHNLYNTNI